MLGCLPDIGLLSQNWFLEVEGGDVGEGERDIASEGIEETVLWSFLE